MLRVLGGPHADALASCSLQLAFNNFSNPSGRRPDRPAPPAPLPVQARLSPANCSAPGVCDDPDRSLPERDASLARPSELGLCDRPASAS